MFNETTSARAPSEQRDGKPGRLRAACTSCHAAKVRCSGEKGGCSRCRTLGHECVYLESRVGKTRGRRKRHMLSPGLRTEQGRMTPVPDQEPRAIAVADPDEDVSNTTGGSLGEPVLSPANSGGDADFLRHDLWGVSQSLSDAAMLETMPELPAMDFFLDYPEKEIQEHIPSPSWVNTNVENDPPQSHRLDSAIDVSDVPPISPTQPSTRAVESNSKTATHGFRTFNKQATPILSRRQTSPITQFPFRPGFPPQDTKGVVVAAAEILEHLEDKMCAGLSAIDEVLRINKEATQKISDLISRSDYPSSTGSSMVVITAAHHVVCLFETACGELYSPPNRGRWSTLSRVDPSHNNSRPFDETRRRLHGGALGCANGLLPTPGIGFGSFMLDPQEQAALCARIISTELHRSLRMVQSLSMPVQAGCFPPSPAGVAVDGWLQDLKQRLRSLISAVESSERIWSR